MKNKGKQFGAVLMTGVLCFTVLSACSSAEPSSSSKPPVSSTPSASSEVPVLSQAPDIDNEKQEETFDSPHTGLVGKSLGEFTTQDVYGKTYTHEIFRDYDLTLVNIFTTWCSPCVAEIPDLEKLHNMMADQGVNVIGVVLDVLDENGEIIQEYLEKAQFLAEQTGATYPFLLPDTTYMNGRLIGIEGFPETFFVDKNGNIVGETYSGSRSLEDWLSVVEQELTNLKEGK